MDVYAQIAQNEQRKTELFAELNDKCDAMYEVMQERTRLLKAEAERTTV